MQHTKHIHILHLLSIIPVDDRRRAKATLEEGVACWDHIFYYIHEHWAAPLSCIGHGDLVYSNRNRSAEEQKEIQDCQELLKMDHSDLVEKISTLPPHFGEVIFPVAVARYLLRDLCLDFSPRYSQTFNEFHRRYGTMILNGY